MRVVSRIFRKGSADERCHHRVSQGRAPLSQTESAKESGHYHSGPPALLNCAKDSVPHRSFVPPGGGAVATEITLDGGFKPGRIPKLFYVNNSSEDRAPFRPLLYMSVPIARYPHSMTAHFSCGRPCLIFRQAIRKAT
jgi:hypothetical protein